MAAVWTRVRNSRSRARSRSRSRRRRGRYVVEWRDPELDILDWRQCFGSLRSRREAIRFTRGHPELGLGLPLFHDLPYRIVRMGRRHFF